MNVKLIVVVLIILFTISCTPDKSTKDNRDILIKLSHLDGVEVTELESRKGYKRSFQLDIIQPVDHSNPSGETFKQRVYLFFNDEKLPMLMHTSGYATSSYPYGELGHMFSNNMLNIPHRYFKGAEPASMDWQYLTVKQSAEDLHRITSKLKSVFSRQWISAGASKGGMTALFYRYFYPEDINATVAYVAPIMTGLYDEKFSHYLDHYAGTKAARDKLKEFQIAVLKNRQAIIEMISSYAAEDNIDFLLSHEKTLEAVTVFYSFDFFQYDKADPHTLPEAYDSPSILFNYLKKAVPLSSYSKQQNYNSRPFYYQALTELGFPDINDTHLKKYLKNTNIKKIRNFAPDTVYPDYNPTLMIKIREWLKTSADKIIYIYGEQDPYTQAAVDYPAGDCLKYVIPYGDHRVRISDLRKYQKDEVSLKLSKWLGIKVNETYNIPGTRHSGPDYLRTGPH